MSEDTHLGESYKEVTAEVSPTSHELILHVTWVSPCSLYLVSTLFFCWVLLTKAHRWLCNNRPHWWFRPYGYWKGATWGEGKWVRRSLVNYRLYNHSINSYYLYLEDMTRSIILPSLPHYSVDYSMAFDKLKRTLCIIVVAIFPHLNERWHLENWGMWSYLCTLPYTCLRCTRKLI